MSLTPSQFAERLAQKIDSREAFDALLIEADDRNAKCIPSASKKAYAYESIRPDPPQDGLHGGRCWPVPRQVDGTALTYPANRWWVVREFLRYRYGVYPELVGPLLDYRDGQLGHLLVHVSTKDTGMVAYTPDPESGERDRQVVTTLGRLVRKYYPIVSDEYITNLDAGHRAAYSQELELLSKTGEIVAAYTTSLVNSCMSHKTGSAWPELPKGYHPTMVYEDQPGLYLAVGRNSTGAINARCLVYINPEDEKDKRFIRVYGDSSLRAKLIRLGFKAGSLAGATLKAVPLPKSKTLYVMPYLDSHESGTRTEYCTTVRSGNVLRVLTPEQRVKFLGDRRNSISTSCGSTSGYADFTHDAEHLFTFTCALAGTKHEANAASIYVFKDGVKRAFADNAKMVDLDGPYPAWHNGKWESCFTLRSNPPELFTAPDGVARIATDAAMDTLGYVRPAQDRYGVRWVLKTQTTTLDGRVLMSEDVFRSIRMVDGKPQLSGVEVPAGSSAQELEKSLVPVHPVGGAPTYATSDVPTSTTRSGAKVVRGIHTGLRLLPNGGLEFRSNLEIRVVMEVRWWSDRRSTEPLDFDSIPNDQLLDRVFKDYASFYATQIPSARSADLTVPSNAPGTWYNFMCCWVHNNVGFEPSIPALSEDGQQVVAGSWPSFPNQFGPNDGQLMVNTYIAFATLCKRIEAGLPFAESVTPEQKRKFVEMARITRRIREYAARGLGAFPHALDGTDTPTSAAAANRVSAERTMAQAEQALGEFLIAE